MRVINTEKLPIKIWMPMDASLLNKENAGIEDEYAGAIVQAKNLANHPVVREYVCLMPDFHVGYGMPIGGVIATHNAVIPNAVGVDIGCGMIAVKTDLTASQLPIEMLKEVRMNIHKRIPVGMTHHKEKQNHPLLTPQSLEALGVKDNPVIKEQAERADYQIGTLGGGNHFIEIQKDQNEDVWVMIHSGSRNLGKQVCDFYHAVAKSYIEMFYANVPDKDLAFLPRGMTAYDEYLKAMKFCMLFAEASRLAMSEQVRLAFADAGAVYEELMKFDTHHNFAEMEHHKNKDFLIHRKGAVKAEGLVTIPGSMGTASYICTGLMNPDSFCSCSHGAGRVMGRKKANSVISHEQAVKMMEHVVFGVRQGEYDEMPIAYKNIDDVIKWQEDLVKPEYRLEPMAVCKG